MDGRDVVSAINEAVCRIPVDRVRRMDRVEVGPEAMAALLVYVGPTARWVDRDGKPHLTIMTEMGLCPVAIRPTLHDAVIAHDTTGEAWPDR